MNRNRAWVPYGILACALVAAAAAALLRPSEAIMPVYLGLAEQLRTGAIESSFEPLGYPWLIALVPLEPITVAAKAVHLAAYGALTVAVVMWLRHGVSAVRVVAAAWVLFNPYVLANIWRVNDNSVNVAAAVVLFGLMHRGARDVAPGRVFTSAACGALVGGWMFVRPNVVSLLPAVVFALEWNGRPELVRRLATSALIAGASTAVVYVALSWVVTNRVVFVPSNGPYNLFAGNNPATRDAVLIDYNGEPSLPSGLAWCGVTGAPRDVAATAYLRCSARFILEQPGAAMRTLAAKAHNLLWRPNLRLADSAAESILQFAMLAPAWLWWAMLMVSVMWRRTNPDPVATAFIVMFALPYVLTNSDPRFRLPLDAICVLSLAGRFKPQERKA